MDSKRPNAKLGKLIVIILTIVEKLRKLIYIYIYIYIYNRAEWSVCLTTNQEGVGSIPGSLPYIGPGTGYAQALEDNSVAN